MNLKTFYKIYYEHRFQKSSIILKIYIIISLPFNFLINKLFLQPVKNLDDLKKKTRIICQRFKFFISIF